jgi:membrane protein
MQLKGVPFTNIKSAVIHTFNSLLKNQTFQAAAALSYYSILSIFPALILLSAIMAYIPLPGFFADALAGMARMMPQGVMPMVYSVLLGVLGANLRAWLSFGTLVTVWVVSSAFDEMIEALDAAYDVTDHRPMWKTRLLAAGLAAITGVMLMVAIASFVIGPKVGEWIAKGMSASRFFVFLWPVIHKAMAIGFVLLAVQMIYYLAPNVKQKFVQTLPGAAVAVVCWMVLSSLLGVYFRYFANYNRIYGTLGGVMALLTWLYWAYIIFLAGGAFNAELAKAGGGGRLPGTDEVSEAPNRDRVA